MTLCMDDVFTDESIDDQRVQDERNVSDSPCETVSTSVAVENVNHKKVRAEHMNV